jgi:hypothetical protein
MTHLLEATVQVALTVAALAAWLLLIRRVEKPK